MRRARDIATGVRARLQDPRAPLWLLGALTLGSVAARLLHLDSPLDPSTHQSALIFDERYYVNAARVILGIHPPHGAPYAQAALMHDPNAEHPPLAKLLIATTMQMFGDNAWGWRAAPIIFGAVAIPAMYWLVRTVRGSRWLALGAATLLAADNLMLVQGRIATLDIFVVTLMIIAAALYLRGSRILAGLALGIALCSELVAIDVVFVLALLEAGRVWLWVDESGRRYVTVRSAALRLGQLAASGVLTYLVLLFALDLLVTPVGAQGVCSAPAGGFSNPIAHTAYMLCSAGRVPGTGGATGVASSPWQWLLNMSPIDYYRVATSVSAGGRVISSTTIIDFQAEMNPAIILVALPALGVAVSELHRRRSIEPLLPIAWFLGTFLPFVVVALPLGSFGGRPAYIYSMLVVMPAVYLGVAAMMSRPWMPRAVVVGYAAIVAYWFVALYPIKTWTGG